MPRAVRPPKEVKLRKPKVFPREGQFPFMDLPTEIRLMIYRYALSSKLHRLSLLEHRLGVRRTHKDRGAKSISYQILRVSPDVYTEALPILYGDNFFQFKNWKPLELFLSQIGAGRRWIKDIEIESLEQGRLHEAKRHALIFLSDSAVLNTLSILGSVCTSTHHRNIESFYNTMAAFLLRMAAVKKSPTAAVALLKFSYSAFLSYHGWAENWGDMPPQDREAWFQGELLKQMKKSGGRGE